MIFKFFIFVWLLCSKKCEYSSKHKNDRIAVYGKQNILMVCIFRTLSQLFLEASPWHCLPPAQHQCTAEQFPSRCNLQGASLTTVSYLLPGLFIQGHLCANTLIKNAFYLKKDTYYFLESNNFKF